MKRKKRKQKRRRKDRRSRAERKKDQKKLDELARLISTVMSNLPRNRDKDGKIVFINERGCYNYVGKITVCSECFYKGCFKWLDAGY